MHYYQTTITFASDRPLTEDDMALLHGALYAQVEEPTDADGDDADWISADVDIETRLL